jgi:hypothetical protein
VLVSENGASQRITRREAFFKTLVARTLKELSLLLCCRARISAKLQNFF